MNPTKTKNDNIQYDINCMNKFLETRKIFKLLHKDLQLSIQFSKYL